MREGRYATTCPACRPSWIKITKGPVKEQCCPIWGHPYLYTSRLCKYNNMRQRGWCHQIVLQLQFISTERGDHHSPSRFYRSRSNTFSTSSHAAVVNIASFNTPCTSKIKQGLVNTVQRSPIWFDVNAALTSKTFENRTGTISSFSSHKILYITYRFYTIYFLSLYYLSTCSTYIISKYFMTETKNCISHVKENNGIQCYEKLCK